MVFHAHDHMSNVLTIDNIIWPKLTTISFMYIKYTKEYNYSIYNRRFYSTFCILKRMEVGLWDHLSVFVYVSPKQLLNVWTDRNETWCVYHATWDHLNGIPHKSLPSLKPLKLR
jgi:hypothetical protein